MALGAGLANLKTLNVACCDKLDDTALEAIAAGCPRMRAIKTDQCGKVTDKSIIALAQQCKQLEAVSFGGCPKLTAQSIEALVANCPRLCYLNLAHCELIPDAALQKLHEALPNCCVKKFFDSPLMDAGAQTQAPTMLQNPGCPHSHVVVWSYTRLSDSSRIHNSCPCLWVHLRMRKMCEKHIRMLLLYARCFKGGGRPEEVPEAMLLNEPEWVRRTPACGAKIKAAYSDHNARMSSIHADTPEPLYKIAEGKIILFSPPVIQR